MKGVKLNKRLSQLEKKCINWDAFHRTATLNLQTLRHVLHNNNNFTQESINDCFDHLEKCLYNTALHCRIENRIRLPVPTVCNLQPPLNINSISKNIEQKVQNKWNNILSSKNPKELWKMIEWKEKSIIDETSSYPSAKKLGNHFQSKSNFDEEEYFSPNSNNIFVLELDMPITMDKVSDASKRLKENKTSADGQIPCMITSISDTLFPILLILLNALFQCALYPKK